MNSNSITESERGTGRVFALTAALLFCCLLVLHVL